MTQKTESTSKKSKNWSFDRSLFYILIFLTPIFFLPTTSSPVAFNKQLLVGVGLIGVLIYMLARFLASGKLVLPPKHLSIAALAIFVFALLSGLFSQAKSVSFLGTSSDSVFWIGMYVVSFFVGVALIRTVKSINIVSILYLSGMVLVSIFSILQLSGIFVLPFTFSTDVGFNPVGSVFAFGFLVASSFVAVLSFLNSASVNKKTRMALWGIAIFFGLIILQINLWSIWLSISIAAILTALVAGSRMMSMKDANIKPLFIPFGLIILSLFFIIIGGQFPKLIANTIEVGLPLETTWDITQKSMTSARWFSGTGPGTFAYNYSLNRPVELNQTNFWGVRFAQGYSAITTYILTLGVLGVLSLLSFLVIFFVSSLRGVIYLSKLSVNRNKNDNFLNGIAIGSISGAAVLAVALFIYKGNPVLHLFLFIYMGIALSALIKLGASASIRLSKKTQVMIVSSVVALVLISGAFGGLYIIGQKYAAQVYLSQGVREYQRTQDLDKSLDKLQSALNLNPSDDSTLRVISQALILRLENIMSNQDLTQQETSVQFNNTFQSAVSAANQATLANPKEVQNWIELGVVYENLIGFVDGASELAAKAYGEARKLDPNNPSLPLSIARVYIANADILQTQSSSLSRSDGDSIKEEQELLDSRVDSLNTAVKHLNESLELKPDYTSASLLLASVYQRLGELDKAIEETEQLVRLTPRDPNIVFQLGLLYYQDKKFEKSVIELERSIALAYGQFANARYYLGLAYEQLDRRIEAIEQFEQLAQDNSGNILVEKILDNLKNNRGLFENISPQGANPPIEDTGGAQEPILPVESI